MSETRAQWLEDLGFASDMTRQVASELESLSTHLRVVGMDGLAQQLERKAICLDGAVELLKRGIGAKVFEDLRVAQQSTDNVLRAALAVSQGDQT